jgi:hypothetical protein
MALQVIGPPLFECDANGRRKSHIGSIFPSRNVLITLPGIHAAQRLAMIDWLNDQRRAEGRPPLTGAEEEAEFTSSVDLIIEADEVLIRPAPDQMDLAFAADELLQTLVSKRSVRFLFLMDSKVRDALKARGERWRISPMPRSREDMRRLIADSKVSIREQPIYYYNRFIGTRYVTYAEFAALGRLEPAALARQLAEIATYCVQRNRLGLPEVAFFGVEAARFGSADCPDIGWTTLAEKELRGCYEELRDRFRDACGPDFLQDDPIAEVWCNQMLSALISQRDQPITHEVLRALSPEFFMQVEWLPGGRFEQGEFVPDPVFEEIDAHPQDEDLLRLCDPLVRGFIFNFIREYGSLDYVNVGRIPQSLSKRRVAQGGRRGVYLGEVMVHGAAEPMVRFIRFQKWGVHEHLDEGKPLLVALLASDEYTDYVQDRRLGVLQLGMHLPPNQSLRRTRERYFGANQELRGQSIPVVYFERDYLRGLATDKLPRSVYQRPGYAERLAALLGRAAAANMICGRATEVGKQVLFDDGDEVVVEDRATGLPAELLVSDPSGAFADYQRPLVEVAEDYARPVNARLAQVPDPAGFAATYLQAMGDEFRRIQGDYRKRHRSFDALFKHYEDEHPGSFTSRWGSVLHRLDATEVDALVAAIRDHFCLPTAR